MRIRRFALGTILLTLAGEAPAQSVGNMLKDDFANAGKDILSVWASPFKASGKDWGLFAASMGAFGVATFADQAVSDWALRNDSSALFKALNPVRRGGVLFSGKYVVRPVAALYVVGIATKNQNMRDAVMGCMASWFAESPPRRALAHVIGRARPDTTDDRNTIGPNEPHIWELGGGNEWVMRSFPGGHIANAMACATFWNKRFDMGVVEPALYAVAAGVGVGRLGDGAHWFSDQVIGTILGYAVGNEVARRSRSRRDETRATGGAGGSGTSFRLSPSAKRMEFSLSWTF